MMKKKHQPTAQDLYRARKQREEQEKDAMLPPGLINHGNTCFMNSTLQGLLATELLRDLVKFQPLPPTVQNTFGASVVAKRSPQLTNGHGLGGEDDRPWVEGMPLGDVFINVMRKAWDIQEGRMRQTMSPKEVLFAIGKKYDQYMDFRQQDAHEFLRHMLDAMRMEELDIIKKRQPPPPKDPRKRSRRKHTLPPVDPTPGAEEKLQSFVDMLFGGHLASILVCEKCKKVSLTYEEFNDLSLSIKPEDYTKDRKRDRFKQFARKLRGPFRQPGARSSSVPPTDRLRHSIETPAHEEEPPTNEGPRRKSFEHTMGEGAQSEDAEREEALDEVKEMVSVGGSPPSAAVEDAEAGAEASDEKDEQESDPKGEESKKDKGDPWGRFGRRLSVSVRMSMKALDPGSPSRSVERGRKVRHKDKEKDKSKDREADRTPARVSEAEVIRTSVASLSSAYDSSSDAGDQSDAARMRLGSASPTPSPLSNPPITAASSSTPHSHNIRRLTGLKGKRKKSVRPPKPSREEQAYLRQLLSDVHVASNNPFAALQQVIANGQTHTATAQAAWTKMGHLPGVEECLRMFTAVEILDGENMVGCHRCWKIAHGLYKPKRPSVMKDEDEDEAATDGEDGDEDSGNSGSSDKRDDLDSMTAQEGTASASTETFPSSPDLSGDGRISPASTSALHSTQSATSLSDALSDNTSVVSAPTTVSTGLSRATGEEDRPERLRAVGLVGRTKPITYGGLPIPSISTTAPESSPSRSAPSSAEDTVHDGGGTPRRPPAQLAGVSPSDDDLLTPRGRRRSKTPDAFDADSDVESVSSYDSDTDISASTSVYSDATSAPSVSASPAVSPRASTDDLPTARPPDPNQTGPTSSKIAKSKQVILRRMYKRYLIADAPPILVVHLKRFQQTSKTYSVSFSGASGVKKLDEYVSFPEFLDIGPFLAPRREDYSLDEDGKVKVRHSDKEQRRCMYRLYAVVVHIGNMLGGHYIAYTALPSPHSATGPPSTPAAEPPASAAASTSESEHGYGAKHEQIPPRQWAYISDTVVRLTTIEEVLKAKAYICMYERI